MSLKTLPSRVNYQPKLRIMPQISETPQQPGEPYFRFDVHASRSSARSKCGFDCGKQIGIAEWLEQESHRSLFERPPAGGLILMSGDEDGRNMMTSKLQFSLKIESGQIRHRDVQNKTVRATHAIRREKFFCR